MREKEGMRREREKANSWLRNSASGQRTLLEEYPVLLLSAYCMNIITMFMLQLTVLHSFKLPSFFWNGLLKFYICKTSRGLALPKRVCTVLCHSLLPSTINKHIGFSYITLYYEKGINLISCMQDYVVSLHVCALY